MSIKLCAAVGMITSAAGMAQAGAGGIQTVPNQNPATLAALLSSGTGITITSITVSAQSAGPASSLGYYGVAGPNNYQLTRGGLVISTGDVSSYSSGPNTAPNTTFDYNTSATPAQEALLAPISNNAPHFDVTQLDIHFTPDPGVTTVGFDVVFGSEEFPDFVGQQFLDAFGLFLNGTNIAFYNGQPININHPNFAPIPETELNGVIAGPVMQFSGMINPGDNTLTIILADTADNFYDSTVYVSGLGVPTPGAAAVFALAGGAALRRRRR